jgi:hypothetical protein
MPIAMVPQMIRGTNVSNIDLANVCSTESGDYSVS